MELNPLNQLNPLVIGAVIIVFTATYLVLRRWFFLPVIEVMESRRMRIEQAEGSRAEARRVVAEAESKAQTLLDAAKEQANVIVEQTREAREELKAAEMAAAQKDVERVLAKGRAAAAALRDVEQAKLRDEAVQCVTLACTKVIGPVEPSLVGSVVDRLMARKVQ